MPRKFDATAERIRLAKGHMEYVFATTPKGPRRVKATAEIAEYATILMQRAEGEAEGVKK